jgi:transcription antitermination factor NusG
VAAAYPDPGREDFKPWFGIQTSMRRESAVAAQLEYRGYQVYLPAYERRVRWSDRIVKKNYPLFPGYLFCRFDRRLPSIMTTPGVVSILGIGGRPQEVPEQEVASIEAMLQSRLQIGEHPFIAEGERIRITQGPLKGVSGVLVETCDSLKVVVSVCLLQRSVAVSLDRQSIECVRAASAYVV